MTKLPRLSGRELVVALGKLGFYVRRQRGSHIVLRRDDPFAQTVVPDHRELDRGTYTCNHPANWALSRRFEFVCTAIDNVRGSPQVARLRVVSYD